ncbi:hypothetical protein FRB99_007918 [Tulasnella sp. 403]|nr:hypothetical protein FRB99_007918 [Tulasnella sp. 403]
MPIYTPSPVQDTPSSDIHSIKDDTFVPPNSSVCSICNSILIRTVPSTTSMCSDCLAAPDRALVNAALVATDLSLKRGVAHTNDKPNVATDATTTALMLSNVPSKVAPQTRPISIPTNPRCQSSPVVAPPSAFLPDLPSSPFSLTKPRSRSDVSDASSRPSLSSSPTESIFSSPPSSPFLDDQHHRPSDHLRSNSFSRPSPSSSSFPVSYTSFTLPDPCADITRLSRTSRGNHCLYPGASFSGTQKSGRNNYEVSITIIDVDFATSFLCGYLRINGLTDDYPELTTYFDAEIIGERFGFLTHDYGASETEDLVHWSRFPAFRSMRSELRRPGLTISDRQRDKRGVVFMRWKERFLVPDWKVKDVNGASFAGFYYVCVEFNPSGRASTCSSAYPNAPSFDDNDDFPTLGAPASAPKSRSAGPATMTGFYYHADSEPYQQLSLTHIPEKATPSFEFR